MKKRQTAIRLRLLAATQVAVGVTFAGQVAMRLVAQVAPQPTSLVIELTKAESVGLNGTQSDGINRFRYTFKVSNTGFIEAKNTKIRFKIPFMHDGPLPNTPVTSSSSSSSASSCTPGFGNICVTPTPPPPPLGSTGSSGSSSSGVPQVAAQNIMFEFAEIVNANDNSSHALINCVTVGGYVECPIGTDLYLGPNNGPGNMAPNKFLHVAMTFRDTSTSPNPRCTFEDSYQFITTTNVTMDNPNQNPGGSTLTVQKDLACVARPQSLPNLSIRVERDPTVSCDPGDAEYPTGFTYADDVVLTKYGFASYLRKPDEPSPGWPAYGTNKLKKVTCPELILSRTGYYNPNNPYLSGETFKKIGRAKPISTIVTVKNNGTAVANNVRIRLFYAVSAYTTLPPVGTVVGNELAPGMWPNDPELLHHALQMESYRLTRSGTLTCVVTGNSSLPSLPDITTASPVNIVMGTYPYYQPSLGPPSNFNKYVTVECKGDAPLSLYPNSQLSFNMKFASQATSSNTTNGVTYSSTAGYLFATCLGDVKSDTPELDVTDNMQVKCPTPFFDPATYSLPFPSSSSSAYSSQSSQAPVPQGIPAVVTQPNPGGSQNAPKGHIDFDAANKRFGIWSCSPTVTLWRYTNVTAWNTDITTLPVNQFSEQAVNNQCGNTTNHRTRIVTFDELVNVACQGMPAGYDLDVRAYVSASAVQLPGSPLHIKCGTPAPAQPVPSSSSSSSAASSMPSSFSSVGAQLTLAPAGLIPGNLDTSMPNIAGWACYKPSYYGSQIYASPGTDLNKAFTIKLYFDGPLGVGTHAQTIVADKEREQAVGNSCYNQNRYKGFSIAPAAEYCDGQIHTVYAYAFDGNLYSVLGTKSFVCGPPTQAQNGLILGDVTGAYPIGISGWTCANPSLNGNTDEKLRVRFYKDGPVGVGTLVQTQTVVANKISGASVGNVCGSYEHSFDMQTAQMPGVCDGTPHQIYVYGFRGGQYNQLSGSPTTIVCDSSSSSSSSSAAGGSCQLVNPTAQAPAGSILRGVNVSGNRTISGYACWWVGFNGFPSGQSPNFGTPFQIRFYMNGPIGVGQLIKTVSANATMPPSLTATCGGNPAHGFVAVLPQNVCPSNPQAAPNQIFVYAVAPNGQYLLIADQSQILPGFLCAQSSAPAVQESQSCTIPAPPVSSSSSSSSSFYSSASSANTSSAQSSSVSPNAPADLAATTIMVDGSPSTPPLYLNQIVRLKMTVKNVGGLAAQNAGFYVAFPGFTILEPYTYGSDAPCVAQQLPNNQGPGLFCGTVPSLAGGSEYTRYVSFRVKPTADCGFNGLFAVFTSTNSPDTNTSNNVKTFPFSTAQNCASTVPPSSSSSSLANSSSSSVPMSSASSASSAMPPAIVSDAHNPFGTHEAANASTVSGVACDLDNASGTVSVLLYDVTNPQAPQYLGTAQANQPGGQMVANVCGGNQNHRWSFPLPSSICTGQPRTVKAFLLNLVGTQGVNTLANGSPRTVTCN